MDFRIGLSVIYDLFELLGMMEGLVSVFFLLLEMLVLMKLMLVLWMVFLWWIVLGK